MKLLFDQNISHRIINILPPGFSECKQVSHVGLKDCDDIDIWQYAKNNHFSIVTFDSDFYDLSLINGWPPKIIWLRTGNLTTIEISHLFMDKHEIIERFINSKESVNIACLEID